VSCVYQLPPVVEETAPRYMERATDGAQFETDEELEAEVVVVGTGAGGAVVAAELAERGVAVVMLEQGNYFTRRHFTGRGIDMQGMMLVDGGATVAVGNCWIPVPIGRTVGGSTTVNSGTCYRIPYRVLAKWRDGLGLKDMTPEGLDPYYAKVENIIRVAPADPKYVGAMGQIIADGCQTLGITRHGPLLRNAPDCDGQGICCFGCPTDAKRSTNVSYVPRALKYGANLVYRVRAERILIDGGRAVGVRARLASGKSLTVRANAVVISCGSILTPLLMLENNLANTSDQVGRNLSIHPAAGVIGIFPHEIRGYAAIPQGYGIEEFHDEGLLYEGAFVPLDLAAGALGVVGPGHTSAMEAFERMAIYGFMLEDTSRGRVRKGIVGRPLITYVLNDHDVARLKRGLEILFRVYLGAGAERIFPPVAGFPEIHNHADIERFRRTEILARDFELTAYHPLGTMRMGIDRRSSVVGPTHETHDVPGLFIVDGSAVPSSIGVNPQLTIMALATRAAKFVAQRVDSRR
jgi:choline dehydrogenase-like flavoprotein